MNRKPPTTILEHDFQFLSELYQADAPEAVLLPEYPSSNSRETIFQNTNQFIIHDPFPPPPSELLKTLGPHHLMFGWGNQLRIASQLEPPTILIEHWRRRLGPQAEPRWQRFDFHAPGPYVVLFPHECISANNQTVAPETNYRLHSKETLEEIDCPQAQVLTSAAPPCVAKISHGYAGLGNYFIRNQQQLDEFKLHRARFWPGAKWVFNEILEGIVGDFGIQFYLGRDGSIYWLGFTEQHFNKSMRWSGGSFDFNLQTKFRDDFLKIAKPVADFLHRHAYFGVVGIDILKNKHNYYLVDLNPRLTGITPFLIASKIYAKRDDLPVGIYRASCKFPGTISELIDMVESIDSVCVSVLSARENSTGHTICHLSANGRKMVDCESTLNQITFASAQREKQSD